MLFVPFTVPTFPTTHQQQTSHPVPAHQTHHQQLQPPAGTQNQVVQQQPPPQLSQLNHLNHQGIVQPPTTNQPTIHSTSCSPQQQATTPNKEMKVNWATSPGNQPKQDTSSDVCCNLANSSSNTNTYFPDKSTGKNPMEKWVCGYRGGNAAHIKPGENEDALQGEFPWMVAGMLKKDSTTYLSGGTLINEKAVLTSAHEVYKLKAANLEVRIGMLNWKSRHETRQEIQVKSIYIHPNFHAKVYVNGYAILILEKSAESNSNVNSICLADSYASFNYTACIQTGWGEDRKAINDHGKHLKKSGVQVLRRNTCENTFRQTYNDDKYKIHKSVVCAEDEHFKAPCTGNGGSPIICPLKDDNKRYVQAGIASIAVCQQRYKPGLFANVIEAQSWIDEVIDSDGLQAESYIP